MAEATQHLKKGYGSQIEALRADGLLGSALDPFWDKELKMHTCCGSTRSYYHKRGCHACRDILKE